MGRAWCYTGPGNHCMGEAGVIDAADNVESGASAAGRASRDAGRDEH